MNRIIPSWATLPDKPSIGDLSGVLPLDKLPAHSHTWADISGSLPIDKLPAHTHSNLIPYTGANQAVDLGSQNLSAGQIKSQKTVVSNGTFGLMLDAVASSGYTYFGRVNGSDVLQNYVGVIRGDVGAWSIGHGNNPQAMLDVRPANATWAGIAVQLAASQTANAIQVTSAGGTAGDRFRVDSTGNAILSGNITTGSDANTPNQSSVAGTLLGSNGNGPWVRGSGALYTISRADSQSTASIYFYSFGTETIQAFGRLGIGGIIQSPNVFLTAGSAGNVSLFGSDGTTLGNLSLASMTASGTLATTGSNSATTVPLTVKTASGQTANVQEWQNNAGSVIGRFVQAYDASVQGPALLAGTAFLGSATGGHAAFGVNNSSGNCFAWINGNGMGLPSGRYLGIGSTNDAMRDVNSAWVTTRWYGSGGTWRAGTTADNSAGSVAAATFTASSWIRQGFTNSTAAPNTTSLPSGATWWQDTVGNTRRFAYNDSGVIFQSPLLRSTIPATPTDLATVISVLQHWGLCA